MIGLCLWLPARESLHRMSLNPIQLCYISIGTNDKAGSSSYLQRWASPLAIKEAFVPTTDWRYPSMEQ